MNITPIQMTNTSSSNQAFTGKIAVKGHWPQRLKKAFLNSDGIKQLADEGYNVTGSLSHRKSKDSEQIHAYRENLYKLKLNVQKENPTFLDRIKSLVGLSTYKINNEHHSANTIELMLKRVSANFYHKRMGK